MADGVNLDEPFEEEELEIRTEGVNAGPSQEELLKQFEAQKAQLEEAKAKLGIQTQFDTLASQLSKAVERPVTVQQAPVAPAPRMTQEELRAKIDKEILDKPYETITAALDSYVGGAFKGLIENQAALAKKIALAAPENATIYSKYRDEVEAAIESVPPAARFQDPQFVEKAINQVKAAHLNDLVAEMVAAELAKQQQGTVAGVKPSPVGVSEGAAAPMPAAGSGKKRVVTLRPGQEANIKAWMSANMIPEHKFSDIVAWAIEDGTINQF